MQIKSTDRERQKIAREGLEKSQAAAAAVAKPPNQLPAVPEPRAEIAVPAKAAPPKKAAPKEEVETVDLLDSDDEEQQVSTLAVFEFARQFYLFVLHLESTWWRP